MADVDVEEKEDKKIQALAALSIGLICVVIGLPVWWKTTEVYRVNLPYSEISSLGNIEVAQAVHFRVVSLADDINLNELQTLIIFEGDTGTQASQLRLQYMGLVSPSSAEEKLLFGSTLSIQDIDNHIQQLNLNARRSSGNYTLYILPASDHRVKRSAVVGTNREAYIAHVSDIEYLVKQIQNIVRHVFVKEEAVHKTLLSTYGTIKMKADKESMRSLRSSPGYELTFTMLNPQPDIVRATWNVGQGVQSFLEPMLSLFSDYVNISVKSQYIHYTGLGVLVEKIKNESRLSQEQLPHIINPVEAYLSSHVSTNPNINFIVYIPTRDQTPLHIYDSSGLRSTTNAFLSPRWGGLMVYNVEAKPEDGSKQSPVHVEIDMKQVLSVFVVQLKLILGIHSTISDDKLHVLSSQNRIVSDWELDQWLRERCIENIFTSAATLKSLAELLDKISNIVINDEIGAQVVTSVEAIKTSVDMLASGHLEEAYLMARKAREASEKAFFDPSLLELLYFPEDQKFAIYIPLFLPVGFPIILSMIEAIKWLRGKNSKEKKE